MRLSRPVVFFIMVLFAVNFISCAGSDKRKQERERETEILHEIKYGRLLAQKILQKYPLWEEESVNEYVNSVGKSVAIFSGRSDFEYHFAVLDTMSINAYATPGGYVFVTKGALKNMKNEAELAGVLAHEIGHINNKHIMKNLPPPREELNVADRLAAFLVSQGAIVSSAFSEAVNQAADLLFDKGYLIEDEYEADALAVSYTDETGYYAGGIVDYIERIRDYKKSHGEAVVYNTHPPFDERIKRIRDRIKESDISLNKPKAEKRFKKEILDLIIK